MNFTDRHAWFFLVLPALAYFLAFFAYPVYDLFYNSLTSAAGSLTPGNFAFMLRDPYLPTILQVTLLFVLGTVALQMAVGVGFALLMNAMTSKLRGVAQMVAILPLMIPPVVTALMWLLLFNQDYGPLNYFLSLLGLTGPDWLASPNYALLAVMLTEVWRYSPFVFLIVYAGLRSIPTQLYEAAVIDGPSPIQLFRYVTFPMLRSSLTVALILDTIGALKGFDIIYVLTNGGPGLATTILSMYIYTVGFVFNYPHYAASLSILFLAIVLAFVGVMLKFTGLEEYLGLKRGKK
jgi:multiple sugar transport system permease protein